MDIREERNGEEEPVRDGGAVRQHLPDPAGYARAGARIPDHAGRRGVHGRRGEDRAGHHYTTLKKLKAAGWIVEIAEDESRILYAATDEGRAVLERDFVRRKRLVAFAEAQLGEAGEEKHG